MELATMKPRMRNKDKRKSVTIAMPPALLRQVDQIAADAQRSRSNIICEALRLVIRAATTKAAE
jgi:metal-responsive CopG/Arc/MetJ family transcriptional regulator